VATKQTAPDGPMEPLSDATKLFNTVLITVLKGVIDSVYEVPNPLLTKKRKQNRKNRGRISSLFYSSDFGTRRIPGVILI
jgi:hypothetical protein